MLGGGVAKRWNDKHVTQNGNNQSLLRAPRQSRASRAALDETHQNPRSQRDVRRRRHEVRRRSITGSRSALKAF